MLHERIGAQALQHRDVRMVYEPFVHQSTAHLGAAFEVLETYHLSNEL